MKLYKGIGYFSVWDHAENIRKYVSERCPGARIVSYTRGWAVQYYTSGPYYPELER